MASRARFPAPKSSADFKDRMNKVDPKLVKIGYSYGPESYDAVVLTALAAQQAKSDAGKDMAAEMKTSPAVARSAPLSPTATS